MPHGIPPPSLSRGWLEVALNPEGRDLGHDREPQRHRGRRFDTRPADDLPHSGIEVVLGQARLAFGEVGGDSRDVCGLKLTVEVLIDTVQYLGTVGVPLVVGMGVQCAPPSRSSDASALVVTRPRSRA